MHADVAQLVAHHLAKVRVAGSNPVVRSAAAPPGPGRILGGLQRPTSNGGVAEWLRQGPAKPCTRVRFPSPPRAISSVGERYLDTVEVTGSIPVSPTSMFQLVRRPVGDHHRQAVFPFWGANGEHGLLTTFPNLVEVTP